MKAQKSGERHILLFYRRTMDRVWKASLALALVLLATWGFALVKKTSLFNFSSDVLLLWAAIVALALGLFAFLARYRAYVQVFSDHLSLVTPFLHLNISYRRLRSVHPVLVQQLFPPKGASWSQRSFLEPFYGKTAVLVEMKGFPVNPTLLKLFLPDQMFSPQFSGLVLLVPDWMKFSTEIDSLQGTWLQTQSIGKSRGQGQS